MFKRQEDQDVLKRPEDQDGLVHQHPSGEADRDVHPCHRVREGQVEVRHEVQGLCRAVLPLHPEVRMQEMWTWLLHP